MPHLRQTADQRQPGSSMRRMPFIVWTCARHIMRGLWAAAAWIESETGAAAALPRLPGQDLCFCESERVCVLEKLGLTPHLPPEIPPHPPSRAVDRTPPG